MRRGRLLLSNTAANAVGQLLSFAVAFALLPRVIAMTGKENFGLWATVLSLMVLLNIADSAVATTASRLISQCTASDDAKRARDGILALGRMALLWHIGMSAVLATGATLAGLIPGVDTALTPLMATLLRLAAITVLCTTIRPIASGIAMGLQRFWLNTVGVIVQCAATLAGFTWALHATNPIVIYASVVLAGSILAPLVTLLLGLRYLPICEMRGRSTNRDTRYQIGFSSLLTLNQVADHMMYTSDRLVLQATCGSSSVTSYHVAQRTNDMAQALISMPLGALIPAISHAKQSGCNSYTHSLNRVGMLLHSALAVPLLCALMLLMDSFMHLWLRAGTNEAVVRCAMLFVSTAIVAAPFKVFSHTLVAHGTIKPTAITKAIFAPINLLASILLSMQIGIAGVVLPTVFYWWVVYPVNMIALMKRSGPITRAIFVRLLIPTFSCIGGVLILRLTLSEIAPPQNWWQFLLQAANITLIGMACFWSAALLWARDTVCDTATALQQLLCKGRRV